MLGKTEGRTRRGPQGEKVGWHHQLVGDECEQTPGAGDGQGGLACCGPWGRRESDTTEHRNSANSPESEGALLQPGLLATPRDPVSGDPAAPVPGSPPLSLGLSLGVVGYPGAGTAHTPPSLSS